VIGHHPRGRATNLGEVILKGTKSKLKVEQVEGHRASGFRASHGRAVFRCLAIERYRGDGNVHEERHPGKIEKIDAKYQFVAARKLYGKCVTIRGEAHRGGPEYTTRAVRSP
jgi:hypothetical protein